MVAMVSFIAASHLGCDAWRIQRAVSAILAQVRNQTPSAGWRLEEYSDLRIHLYEWELARGWRVTDASLTDAENARSCNGRCWLFFVDFQPDAHFAHPTAIALLDLESHAVDVQLASWWPALAPPALPGQDSTWFTVFNTDANLQDPKNIVYPRRLTERLHIGRPRPISEMRRGPRVQVLPMTHPPDTQTQDPAARKKVWAMLVQGYADSSNTFADDISRASTVLRGLRVPETNIREIRPLGWPGSTPSGSSCLQRVHSSMEDLLQAMHSAPAGPTGGCEEFILYFSSHGWDNELLCLHDQDAGLIYFTACDLRALLAAVDGQPYGSPPGSPGVQCDRVTVVLQACESGSLADDVTAALDDDDEYLVLTSARDHEPSWKDLDVALDPNPGDVGSEFSSGLWEAFGRSTADGSGGSGQDHRIDGDEAIRYARNMDAGSLVTSSRPFELRSPSLQSDLLFGGGTVQLPPGADPGINLITPGIANTDASAATIFGNVENSVATELEVTGADTISVATVRLLRQLPGQATSTAISWREVGRSDLKAVLAPNQRLTTTISWNPACELPGESVQLRLAADAPELTAQAVATLSFQVQTQSGCGSTTWIIILIVAGVIVLGSILYWVLRQLH